MSSSRLLTDDMEQDWPNLPILNNTLENTSKSLGFNNEEQAASTLDEGCGPGSHALSKLQTIVPSY